MRQSQALEIMLSGANVFLTGGPGTGKTHLINKFIRTSRRRIAVTASTGIAAVQIGGRTIHSWAGIGACSSLSGDEIDSIAFGPAGDRIRATDTLVIDEVSMLGGATLDMVDDACREARGEWFKPFGGIQVITVGDFFQLPPVKAQFAFTSYAWSDLAPRVCYLTEQHRAAGDLVYAEFLAAVRRGECSLDDPLLEQAFGRGSMPRDITRLCTHNSGVDATNADELTRLPGESRTFCMSSEGDPGLVLELKKGCKSPEFLRLKRGARVIFTRNDPHGGYANGTTGIVADFVAGEPLVRLSDGVYVVAPPANWQVTSDYFDAGRRMWRVDASIRQVPLRLAWAITVHKSQGMTLDAGAAMDLSNAFEYGQGYVALSRLRNSAGLYLLGLNDMALQVHPEVLRKDQEFRLASRNDVCGRAEVRRPCSARIISTVQS